MKNPKSKEMISLLIGLIGVIGTFITIIQIKNSNLRLILLLVCIFLIIFAIIFWLSEKIDLKNAWSILKVCRENGIQSITKNHLDWPEEKIINAKKIDILSVSASSLFKQHKNDFVNALKNKATIRVIIGTPYSFYIEETEEMESKERVGRISEEIEHSEKLLYEFLEDTLLEKNKKILEKYCLVIFHRNFVIL